MKLYNQSDTERHFLDMVERHGRIIYKVCLMYATDGEDINDLYQEVALNLWKAFPAFKGESRESTWVYRIAVNTCISWLRSSMRRPATAPLTVAVTDLIDDDSEHERLHDLYALINRLGKLERALILLWLEERSYEEIAEILNISVSNVGVRINRIKAKLKRVRD